MKNTSTDLPCREMLLDMTKHINIQKTTVLDYHDQPCLSTRKWM